MDKIGFEYLAAKVLEYSNAYAAFVWSRERVFTTWLVSINTSEVVNTTRDFEKNFCISSSQVVKKMASDVNKLDDKKLLQIGINNI